MHKNKPAMAKRWEKETPKGAKLPTKVKRKAKRKSDIMEDKKTSKKDVDVKKAVKPKTVMKMIGGRMREIEVE